ncbi:MAG: hypothetical protein QM737_00595 [Ferruginibacter sp.]
MKNYLLIALFIFFISYSYAQQVTPVENLKTINQDQLILKAKKLNTAGWLFLGTGTALGIAAYAIYPRDYDLLLENKSSDNRAFATAVLTVLGGAAIITSIPMFATSAAKKHRAMLMVKNEKLSLNIPMKTDKNITALSLNISLGIFKK